MRNKIEHTATYLKRQLKTAGARDGGVGALTRLTTRPSEPNLPPGPPADPGTGGSSTQEAPRPTSKANYWQ